MLTRLSKFVPIHKLKCLTNGLFGSKLRYCLPLYANVWVSQEMERNEILRHNCFTKANLQAIQTLQNKVMRLLTGLDRETPVKILLEKSGMLSVNQLAAFTIIVTTHKIKVSCQPSYLARRLGFIENQNIRTQRNQQQILIKFNLSTACEGFIFKAAKLWSHLPSSLSQETNIRRFKKRLIKWIKANIPAIPY